MKQIRYNLIAALLGFLLTFTGCEDFLNQEPLDTFRGQDFWQNRDDSELALFGAYALLRQSYNFDRSFMYFCDVRVGFFRDPYHGGLERNNVDVTQGFNVKMAKWQPFYSAISQCNMIIERLPDIQKKDPNFSKDEMNQFIAEATFIRSLIYFQMCRVWKGVPYIKNYGVWDPQPRTDYTIVYPDLIKDLEAIKEFLPDKYSSEARAARANKTAVDALEAHIYAFLHQYDKAEVAAQRVIESGLYYLLSKEDYHLVFKGRSKEGIFEINFDGDFNEFKLNSHPAWKHVPHPNSMDKNNPLNQPFLNFPGNSGAVIEILPQVFTQIYTEENDMRKDYCVGCTRNNGEPFFAKYRHFAASGPYKGSFEDNIPIFRLADIMLLRAEALITLERYDEARDLINQVRERAECKKAVLVVSDPETEKLVENSELADLALYERGRELMGEGHFWYDLVRTGKLADYHLHVNKAQFDAGAGWYPIFPVEFKNNKYMTQNDYWK